jgi:hypothetical protein
MEREDGGLKTEVGEEGVEGGGGVIIEASDVRWVSLLVCEPTGERDSSSLVFEAGEFTGNISKFQRFIDAEISCMYIY